MDLGVSALHAVVRMATASLVSPTLSHDSHESYGFGLGLVSVVMSCWGHDISVDVVVARKIFHGSCVRSGKYLFRYAA